MRVTNQMMTNNMMSHINRNKNHISKLEEQYSSGKKIQKPSDDPIIAVRALKLRTNVSELDQYFEKNIPDAMAWMDVTESSLSTVNEILRKINTSCVQGSSDPLTASDRSAIAINLQQMKEQIYQEGNANYAGRYVFTGYKTDTPLIFAEKSTNLRYEITEKFTGKQIQLGHKVTGAYNVADYDELTISFDDAPQITNIYRLQLSYDNLDDVDLSDISYSIPDTNGDPVDQPALTNIVKVPVTDDNAYLPGDDEVNFIPETGELILGKNVYDELRKADNILFNYQKSNFENGDLKPEHYFSCVRENTDEPDVDKITFEKNKQPIQYEVNYNQKLTINTEGSDAISHKIGRDITEILNAVNDVLSTEEKISEVNRRLADENLEDEGKERYNKMLEQLDTELTLKKEIMQRTFSNGIVSSNNEQDRVNTAVADLGSRYVRLQLTENRLSDQRVNFTDLMSTNEDADIVDTYIKFGSAQSIYNASLNAAGRVVKNSLLDFI